MSKTYAVPVTFRDDYSGEHRSWVEQVKIPQEIVDQIVNDSKSGEAVCLEAVSYDVLWKAIAESTSISSPGHIAISVMRFLSSIKSQGGPHLLPIDLEATKKANLALGGLREAVERCRRSGHKQAHLNFGALGVCLDTIDAALSHGEGRK